ncbi:hypothetical protein ABIF63_004831 [Bradyrhizobium japonicum]|uniref:Transposase n=1 Tax=Bradyrhizobium japonicum TaxID=375 RepID=A0ABV2RUV2_BRAJP
MNSRLLDKIAGLLWRRPEGSHFGQPSRLEEILSTPPLAPRTGSGVKYIPRPIGCVCPAAANLSCENPECPRKAPCGVAPVPPWLSPLTRSGQR